MLNDSRAGRNPTRVVVPIEEEEENFVGRVPSYKNIRLNIQAY
jgi:hypothetical protein